MKSKIYSNKKLIGTSQLRLIDESMGIVSGTFIPNENYQKIRKIIWNFYSSNSKNKFKKLKRLRLNCQLENGVFLYPIGGFLITDIKELKNEELIFEAAGNYRHVIEDYFISKPTKERIFEPWNFISIEQKISYEDELFKEIGKSYNNSFFEIFNSQKHRLKEFEFNAIAKLGYNDDVLFTINKEGKNEYDYAVIHLTWKGKLEKNDNYPLIDFFENFDHFLNYKMYPDKRDWEE